MILAIGLMGGEAWRSWGVDRPLVFVLDDMLIGAFLLSTAWLVRVETHRRRAAFSGAWAFATGMLYPSFFTKIFDAPHSEAGNWDLGVLTALIGLCFVTAIVGLAASILLPVRKAHLQ